MGVRTIILPVGLSVLRNLAEKKVSLTPGVERAQLSQLIQALGSAVDGLSAELSSLKELKVGPGDEAVFLATDTDDSLYAAKINALIAERRHGINTVTERVQSLVLDNAETFKKYGLPSLFGKLDYFADRAMEQGRALILNISGGVKPIIPYIAIYGLLRQIRITYTFEMTQTLITLPPLPINFDWNSLQRAAQVLQRIDQDTAIDQRQLEALLGEDFARLEGIFEDAGNGQVTLSTFGFMLLGEFQSSREKPVMLSPSAARKLEQTQGTSRQTLENLLDRVRNPLWRAQKYHPIRGTDLDPYKPGDVPYRLAGWVERGMVYVAELYLEHEEYERDLPTRHRSDYQCKDFKPYWPTSAPELVVQEGEALEDRRLAKVLEEKRRLEDKLAEVNRLIRERRQKESNRMRKLREELASAKQECNKLRQQLQSAKHESNKLRQQFRNMEQVYADFSRRLDAMTEEDEKARQ